MGSSCDQLLRQGSTFHPHFQIETQKQPSGWDVEGRVRGEHTAGTAEHNNNALQPRFGARVWRNL